MLDSSPGTRGIFMPTSATSFADALASATATSLASSTTGARINSYALPSLASNPMAVGAAWMISSALFTTYSTTKFIRMSNQQTENISSMTAKGTGLLRPRPSPLASERERLPNRLRRTLLSMSQTLPPASLLTMYRFTGSLLFGLVLHTDVWAIGDRLRATLAAVPALALPAVFLFIANFSNSIALERIGISLTYTSKCGIPLITVLLTLLLDGASSLPNVAALISLVPIAVGIAAASWSSPTFEAVGFAAAVMSATAQSALNVTSKRALTKTGLTGPAGQRTMAAVGLFLTLAFNAVQLLRNGLSKQAIDLKKPASISGPLDEQSKRGRSIPPLWLTGMAAMAYHVEYVLSFVFVKLVAPITYGTCDAIRRLSIILVGRRMFGGDPLTMTNIFGIALALLGALVYSITSSL